MTDLWTNAQVAEHFGVSESRARHILRNNGIKRVYGYPAAEVLAIQRPGQGARTDLKEHAMTTTTALITNAALSGTTHAEGWLNYINGGDYTETQQAKLVENLMAAQEAQFDLSLPDACYWQPETSSIIGPVDVDLSEYDIDELLTAASDWVIDHFAEVEQVAIVGAAEIDPDDQP